ncbi:MAG: ABC transporter substrate-binding protein [Actinomycetota bacterium]|nr:ABC transporter substrate-binding protein [Actinomycetota bacterium]
MNSSSSRWAKRLAMTLLVPLVAAGIAACGGSSGTGGSGGSGEKGELTFAVSSGVASIDPAIACNAFYDYVPVKNLYDTLVQYGEKRDESGAQEIKPMLAESWDINKKNTEYTFHLRDDVTFPSGRKMDAEDVVYGFDRIRKSGGCQDYVLTLGDPKLINSIKAIGKDKVKFTLNEPSPRFLGQLAQTGMSPIDRKELEKHGGMTPEGDEWIATNPIGTGAYTLEKYEPDNEVVMAARDDYWQGEPKNTKVNLRIVSDVTTMKTLIQSGQVDMAAGVPLKDVDTLGEGRQVFSDPSQFYVWLGMNNKKPPFDNVKVRQAVRMAVPVQDIADRLGYGHSETFEGPIPTAMPFYPDLPLVETDLEAAKQIIEEEGASGTSFTIDIKNGDNVAREAATVIQANLAEIGLKARISSLGASAFYDRAATFKGDAHLFKDGAPYNEPAYFLGFLVKCGNAYNWSQYCNERVDQLLAEGKAETDNDRRREIYGEIAKIVAEESPNVTIMAPNDIIIAKDSLTGYVYYDDQQPVLWPISAG